MKTLPVRSVAEFLTKNSDDSKYMKVQMGSLTIENKISPRSGMGFVIGNDSLRFRSTKEGSNYSYGFDIQKLLSVDVAQEAMKSVKIRVNLPQITKGTYHLEKCILSSNNGSFGVNATHIFRLPFANITLDQISCYGKNAWGIDIAHKHINANFVVSLNRTASSFVIPIANTKTCLHIATSSEMKEKAALLQFMYHNKKGSIALEHWFSRPCTELRAQFDTGKVTLGATLQRSYSRFGYSIGASQQVSNKTVLDLCLRSDYSVSCTVTSTTNHIKGKIGVNFDFLRGIPIEPSTSFSIDINMNE